MYGDRGYRGCEGVIVCGSREMRAKRLVVEGVICSCTRGQAFTRGGFPSNFPERTSS